MVYPSPLHHEGHWGGGILAIRPYQVFIIEALRNSNKVGLGGIQQRLLQYPYTHLISSSKSALLFQICHLDNFSMFRPFPPPPTLFTPPSLSISIYNCFNPCVSPSKQNSLSVPSLPTGTAYKIFPYLMQCHCNGTAG